MLKSKKKIAKVFPKRNENMAFAQKYETIQKTHTYIKLKRKNRKNKENRTSSEYFSYAKTEYLVYGGTNPIKFYPPRLEIYPLTEKNMVE